jgi:hypothetical protein
LLTRYIRHVSDCGGTDFICRIDERSLDQFNRLTKFTDEEIAELNALFAEGAPRW